MISCHVKRQDTTLGHDLNLAPRNRHVLALDLPFEAVLNLLFPSRHAFNKYAGEYSEGATPVPIPNTVVKPFMPMILVATGKVGHRPLLSLNEPDSPHGELGSFRLRARGARLRTKLLVCGGSAPNPRFARPRQQARFARAPHTTQEVRSR
jgi:hypothetical protein